MTEVDVQEIEKMKMMREQIKMSLAVVREDYDYMREVLDDISKDLAETERSLEGRR